MYAHEPGKIPVSLDTYNHPRFPGIFVTFNRKIFLNRVNLAIPMYFFNHQHNGCSNFINFNELFIYFLFICLVCLFIYVFVYL